MNSSQEPQKTPQRATHEPRDTPQDTLQRSSHHPNQMALVDSIRDGARVINDKLIAKGYLSSRPDKHKGILLISLDKSQLIKPYEDVIVKEEALENDRKIINTVYSLLDTVEMSTRCLESKNKAVDETKGEVSKLNSEIYKLQRQLGVKDKEIQSFKQNNLRQSIDMKTMKVKVSNLNKKNKEWEHNFQLYSAEVDRELRRNEIEMDDLSNKLQRRKRGRSESQLGRLDDSKVSKRRRMELRGDPRGDARSDPPNPSSPRIESSLESLIDENNRLRAEKEAVLCFSDNIYTFLKKYNDLSFDLRMNMKRTQVPQVPPVPLSFIPSKEDVMHFDATKSDLSALDSRFVDLMGQIETERSEDTFRFKR
ncbi:hypothetical protein FOA43_002088 [Brettanomyces nanus]|uniref:Uncharacterized protein n=1 Tax=Eeniella nana TaxID=13502 RepID=A0A875S317_EENNA|nr:uncharacterized protein FOA43_002088 [Brettanomyces nanus]QPG74755.1 hypothetical protein FOA43_002088 [Brettanomyces nanus]